MNLNSNHYFNSIIYLFFNTFKPLPYAALIAFTLMAVIMIIGAIAGVLIGVEGKGKSLEELSTYK
ncbi:hypothetical protein B7L70_10285 [Vulcanisaeta sp. EB80]|nr:hypothetical protein B7L70_10285 [Vulcanisaeta sp. EB80]